MAARHADPGTSGEPNIRICLALTQARTVDIVGIAGAVGFDAVYVDLEHAATSMETCSMLCSAAIAHGLESYVRVPGPDHHHVALALDAGAVGVIVPHVDDGSTAERVVDACRFPPRGHRSLGGTSAVVDYAPLAGPDLVKALDERTVVAPMIESPAAVEAVADIAAVDGVDMLLLGPHDLTAEMGILGQFDDPRFLDAVDSVAAACATSGVTMAVAGIADPALLSHLIGLGARFISAGTDVGLFTAAATARVRDLRVIAGETSSGPHPPT